MLFSSFVPPKATIFANGVHAVLGQGPKKGIRVIFWPPKWSPALAFAGGKHKHFFLYFFLLFSILSPALFPSSTRCLPAGGSGLIGFSWERGIPWQPAAQADRQRTSTSLSARWGNACWRRRTSQKQPGTAPREWCAPLTTAALRPGSVHCSSLSGKNVNTAGMHTKYTIDGQAHIFKCLCKHMYTFFMYHIHNS